ALPAYTTRPAAAATISCPCVPAISMPLLPLVADEKGTITLPLVGHCQRILATVDVVLDEVTGLAAVLCVVVVVTVVDLVLLSALRSVLLVTGVVVLTVEVVVVVVVGFGVTLATVAAVEVAVLTGCGVIFVLVTTVS